MQQKRVQCASLPHAVQVLWIFFFLTAHTWALHSSEKSIYFLVKRCTLRLWQVYLLCLFPALYCAEACVLICKRSRPACNLFITFQYFILHDEIKEVNWIKNLLTTAFWNGATVSNAQWAFLSICSPSFAYVPIRASNALSDLERPIRKWAMQPI